jgi:cytochrome P450
VLSPIRNEVLGSPDLGTLSDEECLSLYDTIASLHLLNNVVRESLRLVPPVHSSLRVATCDDVVPTQFPIMERSSDGKIRDSGAISVKVPRGTLVHVPVEAFNLDKEVWGEDAWEFKCV